MNEDDYLRNPLACMSQGGSGIFGVRSGYIFSQHEMETAACNRLAALAAACLLGLAEFRRFGLLDPCAQVWKQAITGQHMVSAFIRCHKKVCLDPTILLSLFTGVWWEVPTRRQRRLLTLGLGNAQHL